MITKTHEQIVAAVDELIRIPPFPGKAFGGAADDATALARYRAAAAAAASSAVTRPITIAAAAPGELSMP